MKELVPGLGCLPAPPSMTMAYAPKGPINGTQGRQTPLSPSSSLTLVGAQLPRQQKLMPMVDRGGQIDYIGLNLNNDNVVKLHDECSDTQSHS